MQTRWIDGRAMKEVAAQFIKPNDRLSSLERLEIYNRQYWLRVMECLSEDYPGLRAILGERAFERLAVAYLAENPSRSFTLRNLGRRLLRFMAANPRRLGAAQGPAMDMARLEWAHIEAFDGEARPPLEVDSLLGMEPEKMRLELQPCLSLLRLRYPVDKLLLEARRQERLRGEASNAMEPKARHRQKGLREWQKPETVYLAVHRYGDSVYYKRLEAGQYRLLRALRSGQSLAEACLRLANERADDAELGNQVRAWFATWAALGWFCGTNAR
jgi:hypothetical protein